MKVAIFVFEKRQDEKKIQMQNDKHHFIYYSLYGCFVIRLYKVKYVFIFNVYCDNPVLPPQFYSGIHNDRTIYKISFKFLLLVFTQHLNKRR